MIFTPTNYYGLSQAITLAVWPTLGKLMIGSMVLYRAVEVAKLGFAIAKSSFTSVRGAERFRWKDFIAMSM